MNGYSMNNYQDDVLGDGFEQRTLYLPDDAEGTVTATLIRKKTIPKTTKAVLYIHGFIDYFFQKEMANKFNQEGYDFYALDLRKYGRSHQPHQTWFYVEKLNTYELEISLALSIIQEESHDNVLLAGHSTGGLITTLYVAHHPNHELIKGLWLNSPFFDFNMNSFKKKFALPYLASLGEKLPRLKFPSELNPFYVNSLHKNFQGEWDFNLDWKPKKYNFVYLSFVHTIFQAQKEIHAGAKLNVPTLVMHSDRTTYPRKFNEDAQTSDIILDVKSISRYSKLLQGDINIITIKQGLHDLVLSRPKVREKVYAELFNWIKLKQ